MAVFMSVFLSSIVFSTGVRESTGVLGGPASREESRLSNLTSNSMNFAGLYSVGLLESPAGRTGIGGGN